MLGFRHNATVPTRRTPLRSLVTFSNSITGLTFTGLLTPADAQATRQHLAAPGCDRAFTPVLRSNSVKFESHNLRSNNAELTENTVLHAAKLL